MENKRKAIVAMINGVVHIDPSDVTKETIQKIQTQLGDKVKVVIAPIQTWMPEGGTEALMKEVKKDLGIDKPIISTSKKELKKLYGIK